MPKGKARKDNPGLYQGSSEPQPRSMAPQAVAHRRGGTHRVKDGDQTDSIYDTYNYKELLDAAKERGLYRKDMKKVEMAKALRDHDLEKRRAERNAIIEREKRQQEEKKAQQKRDAERQAAFKAYHERKIEKERRRARHESVSDDTSSDATMEEDVVEKDVVDDYTHEKIGQALSDESWDSTSSDSTVRSVNQPILPDCKLRLFEWPYPRLPPSSLPTLSGHQLETDLPDRLPWKIPYAPLKVITTLTKQKIFLPGQKYPPSVSPDYVPILSLQTRTAARNGVLEGVLCKATIERATYWAERTQVQGWNARMYFNLPSRNEGKDLAETYYNWNLETRKLLRVKGRGDGVPADRERRHGQRHKNKGKKMIEVYEACQYRPLAVCYIPAYLDFDSRRGKEKTHAGDYRSLENLFFIRFPGCDTPHYFFWTRVGEWEDPTIPNLEWDPVNMQQEQMSEHDHGQQNTRRPAQKQPRKTWKPPNKRWIRVKKPDAMHDGASTSSEPTTFARTLANIEYELYSGGFVSTLSKYKAKWTANGKHHAWKIFARALPSLYPSGQMPDAPPVDIQAGSEVATKLAMIDTLEGDEQTPLSPLTGEEAWTRDDDRFWDVVEVDEEVVGTMVKEEDALYRRFSATTGTSHEDWADWLDQISPSSIPPAPTSLPNTPTTETVSSEERQEWEDKFLRPEGHDTSPTCPFCSVGWATTSSEAKAEHMWSHNNNDDVHHRRSTTRQQSPLFTHLPAPQRPRRGTRTTNDNYPDAGADADIDTPITPKAPKPTLRVSTRKRTPRRRVSAQSYIPATSPSSHIPSPPLRLVHRLPADHDNAAWNPRKHSTSGSEHIKSPYLPRVKRYPLDHPNAAWNPRKRSCSSVDSLEFLESYTRGRRKKVGRKRGNGEMRGLDGVGTEGQRRVKRRKMVDVEG